MTITKCDKCGIPLRTKRGIIRIMYPVFDGEKFIIYNLCRGHFIEADSMDSGTFLKWIHEGKE